MMMLLSARNDHDYPEINCVDMEGCHVSGFHLIGFNTGSGTIYLYSGVDSEGGFELIEDGYVTLIKEP